MAVHPQMGTGYARMSNKIANYLADLPGVEVVMYTFDYDERLVIKDRFVDPRIKIYKSLEISKGCDYFALDYIASYLTIEEPDVLFVYNNTIMTKKIMESIPISVLPPIKYLYLDILYEWQDNQTYEYIKACNFDKIFVFLDHWKKHLINDFGFSSLRVYTLPQVIDFEQVVQIPQGEAKKEMKLEPTDYLIVNMNRNARRKGWNVTISAFLEFLKRQNMNPNIKLFCGCFADTPGGYNLISLINNECKRLELDSYKIMSTNILIPDNASAFNDAHINVIYNAADLGMNTAYGEGFGLTTAEHLMYNRPQIVSGIPALKETIGDYASVIEPDLFMYDPPYEVVGGLYGLVDHMKVADCMEYHYKNRDILPNPSEEFKNKCSVENMIKVLDTYFKK